MVDRGSLVVYGRGLVVYGRRLVVDGSGLVVDGRGLVVDGGGFICWRVAAVAAVVTAVVLDVRASSLGLHAVLAVHAMSVTVLPLGELASVGRVDGVVVRVTGKYDGRQKRMVKGV